ncbi:MAG: peptide chain release factor N(5)-glutamine methyltransferase, partial [Pseudomonadota bacterium]
MKATRTVGEAIRAATELLMAHALGVSRTDLLLRHMDAQPPAGLTSILDRRANHEPIAYI